MDKRNKNVAIIGSGPAALTVAENLDTNITIFEELNKFGGMLAYGLPEFRLKGRDVQKRIDLLAEKGVTFIQKQISSLEELNEFDKIIIAMGAGKGKRMKIKGNECLGDALEFLKEYKLHGRNIIEGAKNVAIIGGGNSAIDAARLAKRLCGETTIIYRRTEKEMPAFGNELEEAKKEGVKFMWLTQPLTCSGKEKVKLKCAKMTLGEKGEDGRKRPVETGEEIELEFDSVLVAIGQENKLEWLEKEGIKTEWGKIVVNENYETNKKNVYAIGDVVTGAKDIASATKAGLKLAKILEQ